MSVLSDALRTEVLYLDGNPDYPTPPSTVDFLGSAADELDAKDAIIAELVEAFGYLLDVAPETLSCGYRCQLEIGHMDEEAYSTALGNAKFIISKASQD